MRCKKHWRSSTVQEERLTDEVRHHLLLLLKQAYDKRGIAESLHAQINSARLSTRNIITLEKYTYPLLWGTTSVNRSWVFYGVLTTRSVSKTWLVKCTFSLTCQWVYSYCYLHYCGPLPFRLIHLQNTQACSLIPLAAGPTPPVRLVRFQPDPFFLQAL